MEEQIQKILEEKVNPILERHHGGATLTGFEGRVAKVKLTGACATCPSAMYTMEDTVKEIVLTHCDGVEDVVLDLSVSEDLLDMAKKILNGQFATERSHR